MQWLRSGLVLLVIVCGLWAATNLAQAQNEIPPAPPPAGPPDVPAAPPPVIPPVPAPRAAPAVPPAAHVPPGAVPPAAEAPAPPPAVTRIGPPPPVAPPSPDEKLITMNFQDIELDALVKFISEITGRNFILDDRVKGKVTIISPGKISVDEAYAVFLSVLQVKGFTTVPSGAVLKILPAQEAKSSTVETIFPGRRAIETDEFVTRLIPLENVDVNNMLGIIQPLVSANGLLAAYTATNTMIIIDSAANIDRIVRILKELDIPDKERGIEVIRLNYAFATEIAATLAQVLEEPGGAPQVVGGPAAGRRQPPAPPGTTTAQRRAGQVGAAAAGAAQPVEGGTGAAAYKIIPDERTNALIVVAGPLQMRKIKDLIVRLDVPLPYGTGRIHVYYLKYANVFEITPILSDLIGGGQGVGGLGAGLLGRGLAGSTGFRGGRLGQRGGIGGIGQNLGGGFGGFGGGGFGSGFSGQGGGLGTNFGTGFSGGGSLRGGSLGGAGGQGVASVTGGQNEQFEGLVRISGDPSTNALIINASPQDYETLKQVIVLLDVRRRQVYIEAILMEVRLDTTRELGIELQGAAGTGNGILFGRVNAGSLNAVTDPAALSNLTGLIAAAASNQTIRLPNGTVIPAQIALIRAAETNTDVNILSAPNILTTDNQEAEIVVGQNVPFIASTSTSETNLGNVFNTVERRDVGITLRITPQISEGGMVRLNLFEEVSALVLSPALNAIVPANQLGPTTTIRSATTAVVVRDRQTVVIGGLISDDTQNIENSVPFLSDIPVVGNLFRTTSGMRSKINLLIFLTPHIIRTAAEHRDKSIEERDKLRGAMEEQGVRYKKRKMLEMPSWTPDLTERSTGEEEERGMGATIYKPEELPSGGSAALPQGSSAAAPAYAAQAEPAYAQAEPAHPGLTVAERTAPPPRPSDEFEVVGEPASSNGPYRYVLLGAFTERGTAPPGLQTPTGLIAVALPEGSRLTTLFKPGRQYRFSSDRFDASYRVLEAYPTEQEALLIYPEGLPVDAAKGDYLHWRDFKDATSADPTAWSELR